MVLNKPNFNDGYKWLYALSFYCDPPLINIDIKPDSYLNTINPDNGGLVPVAILRSETLDVSKINLEPFTLGTASKSIKSVGIEDVDSDGLADMVLFFKTKDVGLTERTAELAWWELYGTQNQ